MNIRENGIPTPSGSDSSVADAPGPAASSAAGMEGLLQAVVAACQCMVAHTDVLAGLQAAMEPLARLSGHDRAYVWELVDGQQVCVLIAEWHGPAVGALTAVAGTDRFAVSDFMEVWQPLFAGETYQSITSVKTGANAAFSAAVSNRSDVMVPIFVEGRCWGCIGFDNCREERRYSEAEIQVLRGAAAAVASAVQRSRAEALAEGLKQRHRQLLAAVNEAAAHLVAQPDLDAGLRLALDSLRLHTGVDRVFLNRYAAAERSTYFWLESRRADLPPFTDGFGAGPWPDDDFAEVAHPLREGRIYRSLAEQRRGDNATANDRIGSRSDLIVPIMLDGHYLACIGFDDSTQARHWTDGEVAVLQTAATCISAALGRQQAEAQRLALERSQTLQAQALNALTQGVVRSTRELLDSADFDAGVVRWLARLGQAAQADVAVLMELSDTRAGERGSIASSSIAWRRDGQPVGKLLVPSTLDFDAWTIRLMAQEAVWAHIDELVDPASVQYWRDTDCATNLLVPVVSHGTTRHVLCFDWRVRREYSDADLAVLRTAADSFAAVLHRQTATDALLAERERRLAAEARRAQEASAHAARMQRHSRLLAAVATSAEDLLRADDLDACFDRVLARIGTVTDADRACLAWLTWTPEDPAVLAWQEISNEWTRPGAIRQMDGPLRRFPMRRDDATWSRVFEQFEHEGRMLTRLDDMDEPFGSAQRELGLQWCLAYPVLVDGEMVALLGFDYATEFGSRDGADIDALKTVASCLANAHRHRQLQGRALAAERTRADEQARLASLLSTVVASSRLLIDAEAADFEPAMREWLGAIGRETRAMRATLYDIAPFPATGRPTLRMLCEWVREGVVGSVPCSFAQPYTIDPSGAEDIMGELTSGRIAAVHVERTHGAMRAFLESQGNATVVAVPVFLRGRQWGAVSFDFATHHEIDRTDSAVLQTAADTLSAILRRNEAAAALLAEREARLLVEQRRSNELSRANSALRQALDALAGSDGETAFLRGVLVQLQVQAGALAAYLFRSDDNDGRLRLVGRAAGGQFSDHPAPDDPDMFSRGFEMVPALLETLKPRGRFLWRRVDADAPITDDTPESTRWHRRMGHQANAVHALMVGERQVGFIGMVFDRPEPLTEADLDLAHALSQPITLALELTRLSRLSQRSSEQNAMLKERNRLAREIHDGIAQAFLAIQMQLDPLGEGATGSTPVHKALALARHGLTEARRAVAALRPQGLQNSDLPGAIQQLLAQIGKIGAVDGSVVRPPAWQSLPSQVEDHLFRIVQEAVNNAVRHGKPSRIRVELSQAAGETTVLVADDGAGFDLDRAALQPGFGLESMQQPAQLIGARIDWLTEPGKGTQVLLSWTSPSSPAELEPTPPKAAR